MYPNHLIESLARKYISSSNFFFKPPFYVCHNHARKMAQCSITLIRRAWNKIKKCLLQRQCERGPWILTAGGLLITSVSPLVCQRQKGNPRTDPEQEGIIHACVSDSSPDRSVQWTVCKDNRTNKSWGNKSGTWTPYHSVPGSVLCVMNREGTRAHVCVCEWQDDLHMFLHSTWMLWWFYTNEPHESNSCIQENAAL